MYNGWWGFANSSDKERLEDFSFFVLYFLFTVCFFVFTVLLRSNSGILHIKLNWIESWPTVYVVDSCCTRRHQATPSWPFLTSTSSVNSAVEVMMNVQGGWRSWMQHLPVHSCWSRWNTALTSSSTARTLHPQISWLNKYRIDGRNYLRLSLFISRLRPPIRISLTVSLMKIITRLYWACLGLHEQNIVHIGLYSSNASRMYKVAPKTSLHTPEPICTTFGVLQSSTPFHSQHNHLLILFLSTSRHKDLKVVYSQTQWLRFLGGAML